MQGDRVGPGDIPDHTRNVRGVKQLELRMAAYRAIPTRLARSRWGSYNREIMQTKESKFSFVWRFGCSHLSRTPVIRRCRQVLPP